MNESLGVAGRRAFSYPGFPAAVTGRLRRDDARRVREVPLRCRRSALLASGRKPSDRPAPSSGGWPAGSRSERSTRGWWSSGRPGFGGHHAEAAALRSLHGQGIAPKLLDVVQRDGRTGLVLERFAGPDMLTLLQRQPWRVLSLAGSLATAHLAVHRAIAPSALPDLRQVLAARIQDAVLPPHLRSFATRILDALPDGDRLCHGDYHPGNVLLTADRTAVIDWAGAARGTGEADHARTLLLLRWANPLPGTPLPSRALIAAGRSLLARRYTRTYRRGAPPVRQVHS
jgi:phosphotransferase family enzyme